MPNLVFSTRAASGGLVFGFQQATPPAPSPTGAVTSQSVQGTRLALSGTQQNATAASLSISPASPAHGATAVGPVAGTISGNTFSFSVPDLASGSYAAPVITLTGNGVAYLTGTPFEIIGIDGQPAAAPVEPSILALASSLAAIPGGSVGFVVTPPAQVGVLRFPAAKNGSGFRWDRNDITAEVRDLNTRALVCSLTNVISGPGGGTLSHVSIVPGTSYRVSLYIPAGGTLPRGAWGSDILTAEAS